MIETETNDLSAVMLWISLYLHLLTFIDKTQNLHNLKYLLYNLTKWRELGRRLFSKKIIFKWKWPFACIYLLVIQMLVILMDINLVIFIPRCNQSGLELCLWERKELIWPSHALRKIPLPTPRGAVPHPSTHSSISYSFTFQFEGHMFLCVSGLGYLF
jgi:hypothetical protein